MKKCFLLVGGLFQLLVFSQENTSWNSTFIYAVRLPNPLANYTGVHLAIQYNQKPLVSKTFKLGKSSLKVNNEFHYLDTNSYKIDGKKIPFSLKGQTYYWLLTADMVIEMATFPNRYKVEVVATNTKATKQYHLPETFDLISENSLNIAYLQSLSVSKRHDLLELKTWTLNLSEKKHKPAESMVVKDTTLVFSLRKPIPNGVLKVLPQMNKRDFGTQEFDINNCYLVENIFLMPIQSTEKISKKYPDRATQNFTTIEGKICSKAGGITGMGTGLCAKIKTSKIKYKLTLIIEP